jgi:DNA polymerase-3 subunit gamma/tau
MAYLVLARKYRPQTFAAVVGQQHVTTTLINAINANRVAHAILFSGPRGTGKTTVARILAKAMNCEQGPAPIPCNRCRSCREITAGSAVDVYEIDGASNNSVDQVRELRENVTYRPAHSPYKIYIIDEVHMLSTPAFNALLKTLEEPPDHVLFMFATTEPHKIPITILSRCQRHDFKRISMEAIVRHMQTLGVEEGYELSEASLAVIARQAGGSMRDALSLLDQVMACSEKTVDDRQVRDILGVIDRRVVFDISEAVIAGDVSRLLELLEDVYDRGFDMKRLYAELLEHFRNLLVVKLGAEGQLTELPVVEIDQMSRQTGSVSAAYLTQLFDLFFREEASVRYASHPKLALEMAFFRILQVKPALSIDELIAKLDRLRNEFGPETGTAAAPQRTETAAGTGEREHAAAPLAPPTEADTAAAPGANHTATVSDMDRAWNDIQAAIKQRQPSLAAYLNRCRLKRLGEDRIEIEVNGNGFLLNMIRKPKNLEVIQQVCDTVFARKMQIAVTTGDIAGQDLQKKKDEDNRLKTEALWHPLVADAIQIFDGKVIDVKITKEDDA